MTKRRPQHKKPQPRRKPSLSVPVTFDLDEIVFEFDSAEVTFPHPGDRVLGGGPLSPEPSLTTLTIRGVKVRRRKR